MKNYLRKIIVVLCCLSMVGMARLPYKQAEIYPMSYDQTYQLVISALDDLQPWRLVETDQIKGRIVIGSAEYLHPEKRVTLVVKKIAPFRTKVELDDPQPRKIADQFFKAIDRRFEERAVTYPS